jgi:hypothetical protein
MLNMVAFTAIPKASVSTAVTVKAGFFANIRNASCKSERNVVIATPPRGPLALKRIEPNQQVGVTFLPRRLLFRKDRSTCASVFRFVSRLGFP